MGSNPLNLAIRFLLELTALITFGIWGWYTGNPGWQPYAMASGIPTVAAVIWGIFNVPNDPSRSGKAPVVVPGVIRLIIELAFFALATWALYDLAYTRMSIAFGVVVVLHYLVSYDRIIWLMKR
jgi:hypothetical protein